MINQCDVSLTQGILEEDLWILREGLAGRWVGIRGGQNSWLARGGLQINFTGGN